MNEAELELLRLKIQLEAARVVLRAAVRIAARTAPGVFRSRMQEASHAMRQDYSQIVIPGLPPEYSDLVASEFQAALDDLLKFIGP